MSSRIWTWLLSPSPASIGEPSGPAEDFGADRLPTALGEELLTETPARARTWTAIRDLIGDLDRPRKRDLVDRVLVRFALWVVDLPASEAHHDSGPGGHLDHALKVTHSVVQAIASSTLRLSQDPVEDARERPRWIYAGFAAALLHDAGKLVDLEVSSPDRRTRWTPRAEPLAAFLGRYGLRRTPRELLRFLPGRGLKAHKGRGEIFQALILPTEASVYAGEPLSLVTGAYVEAGQGELPPHVPEAARQIAGLIRSWDKEESMLSTPASRKPAPAALTTGPEMPLKADEESAPPAEEAPSENPAAPAREASGAGIVIPGEEVWGPSLQGFGRDLAAERVLYVLGRLVASGRLSAQGESAKAFLRPDVTWFVFPAALDAVAASESFKTRPDLREKMLALLARVGALLPFGPERYIADVRPRPDAKRPCKVFRVRTSAVFDRATLATLRTWPWELETRNEGGAPGGEPAT
jgi:hypothetical protein